MLTEFRLRSSVLPAPWPSRHPAPGASRRLPAPQRPGRSPDRCRPANRRAPPESGANRRRRLDAVRAPQPLQPHHLFARDQVLAAEQPRHQADLREVLDRFHLVVRGEQIGADRQRAVIREQHAVVRLDVLADRLGQLPRGRRRVLRDRDAAERRQHFGQHGAVERNAGDRKAGGDRRMRVHDRLDVGALTIHLEVHQHLRRRIAIALQLSSLEIGDAHHVGRHEPLADALRRHEQPIGAQAHADVAVVRGGVAARVHPAADFDDVGAERGFGGHAVRPSTRPLRGVL